MIKLFRRKLFFIIVPGLLLLSSIDSFAGSPVHSAKAAGMGTAFIAVADNPSAILFNPAGLTSSKGTQLYLGNTAVKLSSTYYSPNGGSEKTKSQVFFPPHVYLSSDLGYQDMVFGIGIFAPFGIGGRKWPKNGLTKYTSTRDEIATLSINPTIAFKANKNISMGIGINYMRAFSRTERKVDQRIFPAPDGEIRLKGEGGGFGYNLGVLFDIKKISLGLAYRSSIKVDFTGKATLKSIALPLQNAFGGPRFETDMETSLTFPDIWSLGLAYRASEKLTLALDYELLMWSSADNLDLDFKREVPAAGFADTRKILDWEDAGQIKVGAEFKVNEKLFLRGGYAFIETYVPEHTLEPGNPDADLHNFSVGLGYKFDKLLVDAFYTAGIYADRKVNNSILSGKYENSIHTSGASVGYTF